MWVCVYIYIYVCMCVCIYVCMYVCVCIYMYVCVRVCIYREYYTSTRWRRFILQRVVSKTYLTSESELDTFGNHEL